MLSVTIISSCSKRQIVKTDLLEIEAPKYLPIDAELTQDCKKITIEDKEHDVSDLIGYIIDLMVFNQDCTNEKRAIREITTND